LFVSNIVEETAFIAVKHSARVNCWNCSLSGKKDFWWSGFNRNGQPDIPLKSQTVRSKPDTWQPCL